ncbi:ABC transporter substrate-binding protein [Hydrogenoanaerobacterium sp.]|uniref:ABC transporter substrate-binding protein n=1 Tax=Hydrogenoanaerobacterium sp. TaxID=2953763 RepID=UPI00289B2413|nr:ABC transporter substrate-binding protein [Hydrogenoanaerobacterium sp.]
MKKILAILLATSVALSLAACGGTAAPAASGTSSSAPEAAPSSEPSADKILKIGVVQLIEHDALDAAYLGFVDGLKEAGYEDGKNIQIDYQNAQGEQANCVTIADKLVNDKSDLILAIATPAAQAVANKTKDIPILVTAVTDPADAKLVATNAAPGGNVSGTSDLNPIKEQMSLIKELVPTVKKVGMLYSSSEANSVFQVNLAKEELKAMGIESVDYTVSNSNEVQQVVQSMVGKVDAVYSPTDNTIAAGMATVAMVANPAKLPVIVAEGGMVKNGGLATYGLSYYNLGKQTAAMAVKILAEGAKPADMPIEYLKETDLIINKTTAEALGITIPQALAGKAQIVETVAAQ